MRIALVHYWLVGMRGGERVLEALCRLFPAADIYTHVYDPSAVSDEIRRHRVRTTFVQKLPCSRRLYKYYLPLMPLALEQLDLRGYDLVISSESGPAKGVIISPEATHICYCHSPMRYLWDMYPDYIDGKGPVTATAMKAAFHYLRMWDVTSASRVDGFVANSRYTASRIEKYWRRESSVVYPPVAVERFAVSDRDDGYYLWLGQLVGYKRPDIAVRAFVQNGKRLIVAGVGEELPRLRSEATSNIEFVGRVDDAAAQRLLAGCRALVFPGVEDFGIVPIEAMASGKPVIAFKRGGAAETVIDGESGVLFDEQSPEGLNAAVESFESDRSWVDPAAIRRHAERFNEGAFIERMGSIVDAATIATSAWR
jgi:glycosyltransferase involved in cell wall biosynthesis